MTQLAIDLPHRPAFGRTDFLVSECNAAALGWIERWPQWPAHTLVLHGPAGSGKSHLAHLWSERTGGTLIRGEGLSPLEPNELARCRAVALDDAEAPREALLHLYNCCGEAGASLLIVAREAPASWPIALPDLASRLRAAPSVSIALPDDALLAAVLVKHFADRQVRVSPGGHRLSRAPDGALVRRCRRAGRAARPAFAQRRPSDRHRARPPCPGRGG